MEHPRTKQRTNQSDATDLCNEISNPQPVDWINYPFIENIDRLS